MLVKKSKLTQAELASALGLIKSAFKIQKHITRGTQTMEVAGIELLSRAFHAISVARVELVKRPIGILGRKGFDGWGYDIFIQEGLGISLKNIVGWLRLQEAQMRHLEVCPEADTVLAYTGRPWIGGQQTPWDFDVANGYISTGNLKDGKSVLTFRQVYETVYQAVQTGKGPLRGSPQPVIATVILSTAPKPAQEVPSILPEAPKANPQHRMRKRTPKIERPSSAPKRFGDERKPSPPAEKSKKKNRKGDEGDNRHTAKQRNAIATA